jgi:SAM-dependent methyltransferase
MVGSFAAARAYEGYIGRWSRVVAIEFLSWLEKPEHAGWFDVACGTGALTAAVLARCNPARIDASDLNPERIAFARETIVDARVSFTVGEGTTIAAADGTYDAVIGGLAFPAIRDTPAALGEFRRVSRPGGTVAGYVWDFDGEMQLLRSFWNAATELDAAAETSDDDERFAICHPDRLGAAWRAAGLDDVTVRAIDAQAHFVDFNDFWTPFLGGDSPAQKHVQSLDERRREQLRARVRDALPIAEDGSITLITRAWAVKGVNAG